MGKVERPRIRSTGLRGKLPSLQKIAIASGLLNGKTNGEIAESVGVTDSTVSGIVQRDPYIGGLVRRILADYEPEIRECMVMMMATIHRDLQSAENNVVQGARKDLTRVMALSVQSEQGIAQESANITQVVIHLPTNSGSPIPVVPSSNR